MSFTYKKPEDSERTKALLAEQERLKNGRPAAYTPTAYTPGAAAAMSEEYLSKYLNRGQFKYDMNGDALLQQYRSNAQRQGKMAMDDAMGKASSMTGGYGNSFAQTVGQQVYNDSLAEVNNVIPELWQMAYDMYEQEGDNLLAKHGVLADKEATEYARHQDEENRKYQIWSDEYSRWNAEVDRNNSNLWNSMELDRLDNADENSYAYQQDRDAVADNQWQQSFDLSKDAAYSSGGTSEKTVYPSESRVEKFEAALAEGKEAAWQQISMMEAAGVSDSVLEFYAAMIEDRYGFDIPGITTTTVNANVKQGVSDPAKKNRVYSVK